MRFNLLLASCILLALTSCSGDQTAVSTNGTTPAVDSSKIVKPVPPRAYYYPYLKGNKWGYADTTGKIVITPEFDFASSMVNGYGIVIKNKLSAIIDSTGKVVTDFKYEYIGNFKGKLASFSSKGKYGVLNGAGKEVLEAKYNSVSIYESGYIVVVTSDNRTVCYDSEGKLLLDNHYQRIWPNDEGAFFVAQNRSGKYGIVNAKDSVIVPFEYSFITDHWKGNLLGVQKSNKYGLIDLTNKVLLPFEYQYIGYDEQSKLITASKNEKYGILKADGTVVLPIEYDEYIRCDGSAYFPVCQKGKWGMADTTGKIIIPLVYDNVEHVCEGLIAVRSKKGNDFKVAYINIQQDTIIPFADYHSREFHGGLATAGHNEKYGYINKKGEQVIPFRYGFTRDFEHGVALVNNRDSMFYISVTGKEFREK